VCSSDLARREEAMMRSTIGAACDRTTAISPSSLFEEGASHRE
jgi:hypothetical protein